MFTKFGTSVAYSHILPCSFHYDQLIKMSRIKLNCDYGVAGNLFSSCGNFSRLFSLINDDAVFDIIITVECYFGGRFVIFQTAPWREKCTDIKHPCF